MESYSETLLRNIGKAFYLPRKQSNEYRLLLDDILNIFNNARNGTFSRQNIFDGLSRLIASMKRLPPRTTRSNERISTIVEMLQSRSFIPRTILDIGAGNGQITSALAAYYNLPKENVFAIDEKLPPVLDATPITYLNGSIPLNDNSIDVIIMFAVLHHIPPDIRVNIMKEASRVLAPGGYIIIREHNDNHDPNFYIFLDLLHLFWYITENETVDPLYLLSRDETTTLFRQVGLVPVKYSTYPEPNPQRLYHEIFGKNISVEIPTQKLAYQFINKEAKDRLQVYIDILRVAPKTIISLNNVAPLTLRTSLISKYSTNLTNNPDQTWSNIVKEIALTFVLTAVKFVPKINGTNYITVDAIDTAAHHLGWQ